LGIHKDISGASNTPANDTPKNQIDAADRKFYSNSFPPDEYIPKRETDNRATGWTVFRIFPSAIST